MREDTINITHGGAIAVDTEVLRDVAVRLHTVSSFVERAADAAGRAHLPAFFTHGLSTSVDVFALGGAASALGRVRVEIDDAAASTLLMADAFELVELRAQREALLIGSANGWDLSEVESRIEALEASDDRLVPLADGLEAGWEAGRFEGLTDQLSVVSLIPGLGTALYTGVVSSLIVAWGLGKARPRGKRRSEDPVNLWSGQTSRPSAPPANMEEALGRMPSTSGAQVKVEKYTLPDGSRRFAVYVKGTQSGWFGGSNPWDMKSNTELYGGQTSASYEATVEALRQAGAQPGDVVDAYGHSQGGAIVAALAMDSEFDVQTVVTAGSPVEPTLRDDQLLIQLRHTDDLVNFLAGGGSVEGTGSPDSIVVQRVGDAGWGIQDIVLKTHHLETYIETAEMVDGSGDPRVEAYKDRLRSLKDAVSIESTEYLAERK